MMEQNMHISIYVQFVLQNDPEANITSQWKTNSTQVHRMHHNHINHAITLNIGSEETSTT